MAVKSVHYGEIVEVTFKFPGEGYMAYFSPNEVSQSYRTSVKSPYMDRILCKVINSIFELDIDIE